ncbi:MAG TPA: HlyD family efflux transporter periplasmic adaptor subunit [Holophaga sp.]|nr:HlyD family efflux transporter periplasmic adaptor subunit [Holophaga sp.]
MNLDATSALQLKRRRNQCLLVLGGGVILAAGVSASWWYLHASRVVSTDNAYTAVEVAQVTPAVGGIVSEVRVKDTQFVKKGDVLVTLDPVDARWALVQAKAELDQAARRVRGHMAMDANLAAQVQAREADAQSAAAQLEAAQSDCERARIDKQRRQALLGSGSVSGDEVTRATNALEAATARLAAARASAAQAEANLHAARAARAANATLISGADVAANPEVAAARARLEQAQLDLERTVIRACVEGVVAKRTVQVGQRVQSGWPLMVVVPVDQMYVDANYKEVELRRVHVGQPVTLHADLYGAGVTYHGVVEGFAGGSGSAFSAIPAQNATGNWIKVVQRLPVRIKLDPEELRANPLKVGLSMTTEIDTSAKGAPGKGTL